MGPDSSLFVPLLEKAFSKYHGNYAHTVGGDSRRAARTLSGAPYESYNHGDYTVDQLWVILHDRDNAKDMIQVNTSGNNNDY